jgi:hypothetical protein
MDKPEAITFSLDNSNPAASTMRVDVVPCVTSPPGAGHRVTIHTSAAQATVVHRGTGRLKPEDTALFVALARCAYAEGRAAGGGDGSEVILTAPEAGDDGLPTHIGGRWMGAVAWLHYSDDKGNLQCGAHVTRIRGFNGAANIVAAIIEGAVVCPRCAEMHRLEAAAVKTGAQHVDG